MRLTEGNMYHIFNRGNNRQKIFLEPKNYDYFIRKMRKHLVPCCDILAWCLMPNHFHLLIYANLQSVCLLNDGSIPCQKFSKAIQKMLSGYALGINKQNNRTGSLFQKGTKSVFATNHAEAVFHYIHQNPVRAGLVNKLEDWHYSSFREHCGGIQEFSLCNLRLANELLQINFESFYKESYDVIETLDVPKHLAL